MCYKENGKKQNFFKEKFFKNKTVKKKDNYIGTFKPLRTNRNHQALTGPYKIRFLLIYFIIMIKIKVATCLRNKKLNELNEITIKIIGTGEQSILSSRFSPQPSKILLNGESTYIDPQNKINILEGDINNITMQWNDKIDNCHSMFDGLTNLKEVDLSNFDGSEILSMAYMFWDCTNLDTSSVTNMASMFYDCNSLTSINLTNLNTSKVKEMEYLFYSCTSLTSVDLSYFNTSAVTVMSYMFSNCLSLTSLDLSKFNTDSLETINGLFSDCKNLAYINMQNFDVSKTTSLFGLFKGCQNLEYINLNNFIEGDNIRNSDSFFEEVPNNITY